MGRVGYGAIAVFLVAGMAQCKGPKCTGTLVVVSRVVTEEELALPILDNLHDVEEPKGDSNGCEHSDEEHKAKLGPLFAHYTAWNYKGQTVTTGGVVYISAGPCSNEIAFSMTSRSDVRIRHDPKRDVYIVTDRYGGPRHDAGERDDEKRNGLILRISTAN